MKATTHDFLIRKYVDKLLSKLILVLRTQILLVRYIDKSSKIDTIICSNIHINLLFNNTMSDDCPIST